MSEIQEVLAAISALAERDEPMALATIVATRGSTYRRAGARFLVPAAGEPIGNLSGGCLEGDVARVAHEVMAGGAPRLLTFDMTADGEEIWGYGLGCNGAIDVFVEPGSMAVATAAAFREAMVANRPAALLTVIESTTSEAPLGARLLLEPDGSVSGGISGGLDSAARDAARDALAEGRSQVVTLGSAARAFVEVARPPLRLVVLDEDLSAIGTMVAGRWAYREPLDAREQARADRLRTGS